MRDRKHTRPNQSVRKAKMVNDRRGTPRRVWFLRFGMGLVVLMVISYVGAKIQGRMDQRMSHAHQSVIDSDLKHQRAPASLPPPVKN